MNTPRNLRRARRPFLATLLSLLAGRATAQNLFQPTALGTGNQPQACAFADLNGDARGDVVAANYQDDSFSVFLANGAGGLNPAFTIPFPNPLGVVAGSIAVADLTGDGRPDLVTATYWTPGVAVLPGDGAGGFGAAAAVPLAAAAQAVRVADLDGDGDLDVAAASANGSAFYTLRNGAGGLAPLQTVPFAAPFGPPKPSFEITDLTGDGKPDLAAPTGSLPGFAVWPGLGPGAFGSIALASLPGGPSPVIAVGNTAITGSTVVGVLDVSAGLARFASIGAGGAVTPLLVTTSVGPSTAGLSMSDLNGDGLADLLVLRAASPSVGLAETYLFGISGLSANFLWKESWSVGAGPTSAAIGDAEGNGKPDAFVVAGGVDQLTMLRNLTGIPSGSSIFGAGTPGCSGALGLGAAAHSVIGSSWTIECTNAPPRALGAVLIGDQESFFGNDPFALGATFHVDLFASTLLESVNVKSGHDGIGVASVPIPNVPALSGLQLYAQAIFLEPLGWSCSPSPFGLVTTRGFGFHI